MCGAAVAVGRSVVLQLLDAADRRGRQRDQTSRARAVVQVLVPLVAERAGGKRRAPARGRARQPVYYARTAATRKRLRRESRRRRARQLTVKIVPVSAFSGFPPSAGGLNRLSRHVPSTSWSQRIDLRVGVGFLVADQRAIRRIGAVDAGFPARLPEHFVAAEEGEAARRPRARLPRWRAAVPTSTRRGRPTERSGAREFSRADRSVSTPVE